MVITSTHNEKYKYIKSLLTRKGRLQYRQFAVEGVKSVEEALASSMRVSAVVMSEAFYAANRELAERACGCGAQLIVVADALFGGLCDTETPQGVLCIVDLPGQTCDLDGGMYVYCDRIADPGNLGTIIRTAAAAGAAGVVLSEGCAEVYSPKAIRATMGSFFHIPVYNGCSTDMLAEYRRRGFRMVAGALAEHAKDYRSVDFSGNVIIVIGNEANGVSGAVLALADEIAKIPIQPQIESLNASVAAALLIYEWRRSLPEV